jgi:hypothetical protein
MEHNIAAATQTERRGVMPEPSPLHRLPLRATLWAHHAEGDGYFFYRESSITPKSCVPSR